MKKILYALNVLSFLISYSGWHYFVRISGYPWYISLLGVVSILAIYIIVCFCIGKWGDKR